MVRTEQELFTRLLNNRSLQRLALRLLRSTMPIARFGNNVVVTPYDAVTEMLQRPNDFSVLAIYQAKMQNTSGDFYLGMDDTPQYHEERKLTDRALRALDLEEYRKLTQEFVSEALAEPLRRGSLDLVQELSWLVPARLCEDFFGIEAPERRTLLRWVRYIFQHLFLNLGDDPVVAKRAEALAAEMRSHVDQLIARCRADLASEGSQRRDFLSQLVRLQNQAHGSDNVIRRNVAGVVLGSVDTISRCVVNALEELLARPEQLAEVQKAARAGDRDTVASYVFEALRFNPHNPLIVRVAPEATTLKTGSRKATAIPAGSRVFAMTYAAMFDPEHYTEPSAFRIDRGDLSHLGFGYGFHRCFGERAALIAVVEILLPILTLNQLSRVSGQAGQVVWDGPFPDHFQLQFQPDPAFSGA